MLFRSQGPRRPWGHTSTTSTSSGIGLTEYGVRSMPGEGGASALATPLLGIALHMLVDARHGSTCNVHVALLSSCWSPIACPAPSHALPLVHQPSFLLEPCLLVQPTNGQSQPHANAAARVPAIQCALPTSPRTRPASSSSSSSLALVLHSAHFPHTNRHQSTTPMALPMSTPRVHGHTRPCPFSDQ